MAEISFSGPVINEKIEKLSVVVAADSFSFGFINDTGQIQSVDFIQTDGIPAIESLKEKIRGLIEEYSPDRITVASKQPPVLHTHKVDDKLINFFPLFEGKQVFREKFTGEEVFTYFGLNDTQIQLLDGLLKNYALHHYSMVLANYHYPSGSGAVHADFDNGRLHIFYSNQEGFRFYNSFGFSTHEDVLYYILSVYRYLALDPHEAELRISGLIDTNSGLLKLIRGYVAYISVATAYPCLPVVSELTIPVHYYFDIGATALCES
ncbi:MAG: DUF3822 family protein [Saprospiraceae bacterium]|nr:DUF3822 family protein [Saprospiraceae bacterium]